jgi:hypothetical protein
LARISCDSPRFSIKINQIDERLLVTPILTLSRFPMLERPRLVIVHPDSAAARRRLGDGRTGRNRTRRCTTDRPGLMLVVPEQTGEIIEE